MPQIDSARKRASQFRQALAITRMIDKLQKVAQAIQILRVPSIVVALIGLASTVMIIYSSRSHVVRRECPS